MGGEKRARTAKPTGRRGHLPPKTPLPFALLACYFFGMRHRRTDPSLTRYARENRRSMSIIEGIVWKELRRNQLGVRFRRQEPIGPYLVDFVCIPLQLVIELDGPSHDHEARNDGQPEYDWRRDAYLRRRGFTVLRFTNQEVWNDHDAVLRAIESAIESLPPADADP